MAEQLRKQTIQQNQPKATPERDFSPLFNNGKTIDRNQKSYPNKRPSLMKISRLS
jgi:hypothetical protein